MKYEIEKIGMPEKIENRGAKRKYPFYEMEVGDSFLVGREEATKARVAASAAGKRNGVKFSCLSVEGGLRIWRVE